MQELNDTPTFSRYNIERTLGSGGMGTVYLAHHNILNRSVALKVPKRELAQNEIFVERFLREARALGTLNHPHIVTVYDAGIEQDIPYIAMEYVAGDTLAHSILNTGQIDFGLAISWGLQMARALAYLHQQQILHRDLKSANVIIDRAGNAVIADFGIAQIDEDSNLTRGMLGTPAYISPEQAKGAQLDARSDLYSLGIILYECLTGRLPFRDENSFALIQKVIHEAPEDIWNHRPDAPLWLCDLINKCLEKSPERRFQDGFELSRALQQGLPDDSPLMRSEPADTIVSHVTKTGLSIADQYRMNSSPNIAHSLRIQAQGGDAIPFQDPSPTVTLHGLGQISQIIQPIKKKKKLNAVMNPASITSMLAMLIALILIPLKHLPPDTASGFQNTTEAALPAQLPKNSNPIEGGGTLESAIVESVEIESLEIESLEFPIPHQDNNVLESEKPVQQEALAGQKNTLDVEIIPSYQPILADLLSPLLPSSSSVDSVEDISSIDSLKNQNIADNVEPEKVDTASAFQLESVKPIPVDDTSLIETVSNWEDVEIDVSLLEDQLETQSSFLDLKGIEVHLPQSIALLSDLKNRTELIRALAVYQAKKVLLFGTRSNVTEPDLAYIFLINKENKKIRGLLAPSYEGWTDVYTGKIVTEEQGRFYEQEPNSETTLKWWLHDVSPIWVELKLEEKLVSRQRSTRKKKKRPGW